MDSHQIKKNYVRLPLMSLSKTCLKIAAQHCNVLASDQNAITCQAPVFLLPLTTSLSLPQFKSFSLPIWASHVWLSLTSSFYISADGPIGPANIILNQKSGDGGVGEGRSAMEE